MHLIEILPKIKLSKLRREIRRVSLLRSWSAVKMRRTVHRTSLQAAVLCSEPDIGLPGQGS